MGVLVIAEHDNATLAGATLSAITAAVRLDDAVQVLVAGHGCRAVAEAAARVQGVSLVRHSEAAHYARPTAEDLAALVVDLAADFTYVLAPASTFGKNFLPRVAAILDVAMISDLIRIEGPDRFVRPIYAGNAVATVQSTDPIKVVSVRATAFDAAPSGATAVPIEALEAKPHSDLAEVLAEQLTQSERPELTAAEIVVAGGRGMGSAEGFRLLEEIADRLGAAIGASRAAVDAGYVPNDYQVGQTGKIVAPKLYIAVGISGAIQHLAGMKDAKVVVAINKDEAAPIFQVADYALVADLFQALPELGAELKRVLAK
ncbi:electron transfer flavoprotein subunit alpha/FixB family protein [Nitrococcus mobilis]|uniref:Electron transfer flavoprotein subunit alpha n=1 Tax=Nitrococcus mobilis Nb-231 TaxID=314278 RepID=A4BLG2_9GAMM|nr:FAD-binding protein [Nitrococcus mobilis]EAR23150.1 Electron transfer flavoprotein beta-subunit:Electron transfer flavoprotein, alpha subunit [Nitrococcus mobilis Nb-231]